MHKAALLALAVAAGALPAAAECGIASWYGPGFHGRRTASGEVFDQHAVTCAHRTARLGSRLAVTDRRTGRTVVCRVNDRGPHVRGRVVDLSRRTAEMLGMIHKGVARVCITRR